MKNLYKRFRQSRIGALSLILTLALLLGLMNPFAVAAEESVGSEQETGVQPNHDASSALSTDGDLTPEELATAELSPEDIPDLVSAEAIAEKGHVHRLWEQETDLSTVVFQNQDGTKTAYLFAQPVKYVDEDGIVRDKRNTLTDAISNPAYVNDYAYVNTCNDIKTYYPNSISPERGMVLEAGNVTIELAPVSSELSRKSAATGETTRAASVGSAQRVTDTVEYAGVFGAGTTLRYTTTYEGFKEDIILHENTGHNRFSFRLITHGLSLVIGEDGAYYLADPLTGGYIAEIGELIVTDSGEFAYVPDFNANHYYEIEVVERDQEYIITAVVDETFLDDPGTVYPVTVDPTVTINTSGSGTSKTIMDVPVYKNTTAPQGGSGVNTAYVGYPGTSGFGEGRWYLRFPGLENNAIFKNSLIGQVNKLELYVYQIYANATATMKTYNYTGSPWTESTLAWSTLIWSYISTPNSTRSISSGMLYVSIDLTTSAVRWKKDPSTLSAIRGIVIANDTNTTSSSYCKLFYRTTASSNKPYLVYTYNNVPPGVYSSAGGVASKAVSIQLVSGLATGSTWQPIITAACSSWNTSAAKTGISTTTASSPHTIEVKSVQNVNWDGGAWKYPLNQNVVATSSEIVINTTGPKNLGANTTNLRNACVIHELGHLLWLKDDPTKPSTSTCSIMTYADVDNNGIRTPQTFDCDNVVYRYG